MSFLFDKDPAEIQRLGQALKVQQDFRAPAEFGVNIGGRQALNLTSTGPTSSTVDLTGTPGFAGNIGALRGRNTAANNRVSALTGRLSGNENPFINARVRPAEQANRENIAQTVRNVGQRNVRGSLGDTDIRNTQIIGNREVNDQRALATQEALNSQLAAETTRLGLGDEELGIIDREMREELQQIDSAMQALRTSLENQKQTSTQLSGGLASQVGTPLDDVGSIIDILDTLFGGV